jgi:hypothetical protein
MGSYQFQANEVEIMKIGEVTRRKSMFSIENGELILTNLFLVWNTKNMFGKTKNTEQYPLRNIKVFNDKAQIKCHKNVNMNNPILTIYFTNGEAVFEFMNKSEHEIKKIANSINHVVTGTKENIYEVTNIYIPGIGKAAEVLKGTVDVFKDTFGVKQNKQYENINEKIAKKCSSCSAPISGTKGEVVYCNYCDTNQQL